MIPENTLIGLYSLEDKKTVYFTIEKDKIFSSHHGIIPHNQILEKNFGDTIETHKNKTYLILKPSLYDLIMNIKRHTQILYPKDIGFVLLKLGLRNGDRVIEAGTGSGALTIAMAYAVSPEGKVYTYEQKEDFSLKAEKNLIMAGIRHFVEMKVQNVEEQPFIEKEVDAIFLDIKTPVKSIEFAFQSLRKGGTLAFLLPTTNQVSEVLRELSHYSFIETEVVEILYRKYKINPDRLRPEDRMVGHTGYLVFTRKSL